MGLGSCAGNERAGSCGSERPTLDVAELAPSPDSFAERVGTIKCDSERPALDVAELPPSPDSFAERVGTIQCGVAAELASALDVAEWPG